MGKAQIGLLHPGEMGAAVGACLVAAGHPVFWASTGRGPATAARAEAAGLRDAGTVGALARQADVILSICPPHAALDVARSVAGSAAPGFGGVFVDANAIAPGTAEEVARIVEAGGGDYVDGGIIGLPPSVPGRTRLYLSGARAGEVRHLFASTALDARVIGDDLTRGDLAPASALTGGDLTAGDLTAGDLTAASALKMAYAGWTKGTAALILAVRGLARAAGVEDALLAEWRESQPELASTSQRAASSAATKGWRWVGEMEEIAASMAAAGLPRGFHEAAAEIFRRSPRSGAALADEPAVASILDALRP
jgi:3-hydroxyisobutyrate dehydrogenase-like beta-hydroxyacid dehydrogenase